MPELIWWKHAKPCHGNSAIPAEGDYYVRDAVYDLVVARQKANNSSNGNTNGSGAHNLGAGGGHQLAPMNDANAVAGPSGSS